MSAMKVIRNGKVIKVEDKIEYANPYIRTKLEFEEYLRDQGICSQAIQDIWPEFEPAALAGIAISKMMLGRIVACLGTRNPEIFEFLS